MQHGNQSRHPSFRYAAPSGRPVQSNKVSHAHDGKRLLKLFYITSILSAMLIIIISANAKASILDTQNRVLAAEVTVPITSGPRIQPQRLEQEIGALIAEHPELEISVSYKDLTRNRSFQYGSDNAFTAASVPKLITAALYLDEVDKGNRSLSDNIDGVSARQLLKAMIEVSDNSAWLSLNTELGYDELETYAASIGIEDYDSWNNTVPAEGIAILLQKLYERQLLSAASTDLLLGYMEAANYRQYIVTAIDDDSTVYHKVGYLNDRVHDAAVIDNGKHAYVLVIFTKAKSGGYNFSEGGGLIKDITRSIHQGYEL